MIHYGSNQFQIDFEHDSDGLVDYDYDPGDYSAWYNQQSSPYSIRVSFGTRTDDYPHCHLQGQFWSFKVYNECRVYDEESKSPYSQLDPTVAVSGDRLYGTSYNADLEVESSQIVPSKLYRLSELTVWKDYWEFSGFQLKFEAPDDYTGYPPIIYTYGSTRFAVFMDTKTIDKSKIITYYELKTTHWHNGLRLISFQSRTEFSLGSLEEVEILATYPSSYGYSEKKVSVNSNLIGVEATLGPSKYGTIQNIRHLNLVFDSNSCETARFTWSSPPTTLIELEIGGDVTPYWEDSYDFCYSAWDVQCPMHTTITGIEPEMITVDATSGLHIEISTEDPNHKGFYVIEIALALDYNPDGYYLYDERDSYSFNLDVTVKR